MLWKDLGFLNWRKGKSSSEKVLWNDQKLQKRWIDIRRSSTKLADIKTKIPETCRRPVEDKLYSLKSMMTGENENFQGNRHRRLVIYKHLETIYSFLAKSRNTERLLSYKKWFLTARQWRSSLMMIFLRNLNFSGSRNILWRR